MSPSHKDVLDRIHRNRVSAELQAINKIGRRPKTKQPGKCIERRSWASMLWMKPPATSDLSVSVSVSKNQSIKTPENFEASLGFSMHCTPISGPVHFDLARPEPWQIVAVQVLSRISWTPKTPNTVNTARRMTNATLSGCAVVVSVQESERQKHILQIAL